MAIGTTPLFSKISGSAGPVDYRTRRNGKIEIGKKRIPANPESTRQLEVRAGYGRLHELWQNASYIDKAQYERLGKLYDISPWNAFLLRHQSALSLAPVISSGMVESSGSDLHDLTTNNNQGTISGAIWDDVSLANTSSLLFDGIDDVVNCGTGPTLNIRNRLSFTVWIYPTSTGDADFRYIAYKNKYRLYYDGKPGGQRAMLFVVFSTIGKDAWSPPDSVLPNMWTCVGGVYNGANVITYINGIEFVGDAATGLIDDSSTDPLGIGAQVGGTRAYKGQIALPVIYDTLLSPAQFLNYYNNTKHLFGVYP